jgi:phosphopantetheinyl transferase
MVTSNRESAPPHQEDNSLPALLEKNAITVEVTQLDLLAVSRKERRKVQSLTARNLLSSALVRLYGKNKSESWPLVKSLNGKPFLRGNDTPSISIAHSDNWVACAIAPSASIGIDIEAIKSRNWDAYCQDVFHPLEASWVLGGFGNERNIRGLTCWCRKEAIVKALGVGMIVPPSSIGFSPEGVLVAFPQELGSPSGWLTHSTVIQNQAVFVAAWKC